MRAAPRDRSLLNTLKDDLIAAGGSVEIAYRRLRRQFAQLMIRARFQIDEPEVLAVYIAAQNHQALTIAPKGDSPGSSREHDRWQRIRSAVSRDSPHGKCLSPRPDLNKSRFGRQVTS
jgi:hypothetical protein